jgi:hypothetical protein
MTEPRYCVAELIHATRQDPAEFCEQEALPDSEFCEKHDEDQREYDPRDDEYHPGPYDWPGEHSPDL